MSTILTEGATPVPHPHNDALKYSVLGRFFVNDPHTAFVNRVMADTRAFFQQSTRHHPSEAMLTAMADIPSVIFRIIQGTASPAYYLSRLDAGVGKTTTLRHTIQALRNEGTLLTRPLDVGAVLALGRLTQIEHMIQGMGLEPAEYAVLAAQNQRTQADGPFAGRLLSDLGLGQARISEAPILLTTHAMIESRLSAKAWADAREFFYRGHPRLLRVWDESVFVRQGITVDRFALRKVEGHLREFSDITERFVAEMDAADDGAILTVPDYASQSDLQTVWAGLSAPLRSVLNDTLQDLWYISGKPARVRKDGNKGTLVQYQTTLPDDIKPMLVLDASARVRGTYQQ